MASKTIEIAHLAEPWKRIVASIIDTALITAFGLAVIYLIPAVNPFRELTTTDRLILWFDESWAAWVVAAYFVIMNSFTFGTVGKHVMGIAIVNLNQEKKPLGFSKGIWRSGASILIPLGLTAVGLAWWLAFEEPRNSANNEITRSFIFIAASRGLISFAALGIAIKSLIDIFNPEKARQSVMDKVAGTLVVNKASLRVTEPMPNVAPPTNNPINI